MARPKDNLDLDVMDALRLGYGCRYGDFKADHPHTAAANEARLQNKKRETRPVYEFICRGCGKKFTTKNKTRKYCTDDCRNRKASAYYRELAKTEKEEKHD